MTNQTRDAASNPAPDADVKIVREALIEGKTAGGASNGVNGLAEIPGAQVAGQPAAPECACRKALKMIDPISEIIPDDWEWKPYMTIGGARKLRAALSTPCTLEHERDMWRDAHDYMNRRATEALVQVAMLKQENAQLRVEAEENQTEHNKLMEYARNVKGSRDVHSIYEVLDLIPEFRAELAPERWANWKNLCGRLETLLSDIRTRWYAAAEYPNCSPEVCECCLGDARVQHTCVAELRKGNQDSERLSWLIRQGPPGAVEGIGLNDEAWEAPTACVDHEARTTDQEAMRAAIDAARARSTSA